MRDEIRRQALAEFLRTRRAKVSPESVGMIRGLRRRTPGLRREEVAELAGLGIAWYTWLEQARNIKVSEDVLAAISRALQLTDDEREHLFALGRPSYSARCDEPGSTGNVPERELSILDALNPNPAYIRDAFWNVLASNNSFLCVSRCDSVPAEDRNLLLFLFTDPWMRSLHADWEGTAQFAVAQFRYETSHHLDDERVIELVERLRAESHEFRELWSFCDVVSGVGTHAYWTHPVGGSMELERCSMRLAPDLASSGIGSGRRINVLMPVPGTPTESGLQALLEHAA